MCYFGQFVSKKRFITTLPQALNLTFLLFKLCKKLIVPSEFAFRSVSYRLGTQDKDYRRTLVNATLNLWVPLAVELVGIKEIGSEYYVTFKYLGSLVTNRNPIQEEIKCRLKAGNSCYYSVQTLVFSTSL